MKRASKLLVLLLAVALVVTGLVLAVSAYTPETTGSGAKFATFAGDYYWSGSAKNDPSSGSVTVKGHADWDEPFHSDFRVLIDENTRPASLYIRYGHANKKAVLFGITKSGINLAKDIFGASTTIVSFTEEDYGFHHVEFAYKQDVAVNAEGTGIDYTFSFYFWVDGNPVENGAGTGNYAFAAASSTILTNRLALYGATVVDGAAVKQEALTDCGATSKGDNGMATAYFYWYNNNSIYNTGAGTYNMFYLDNWHAGRGEIAPIGYKSVNYHLNGGSMRTATWTGAQLACAHNDISHENTHYFPYNDSYTVSEAHHYFDPAGTNTLPTPVKPGYTFLGWYADEGLTIPVTELGDASVELYAKWSEQGAAIAYTLGDGAYLNDVPPYALAYADGAQSVTVPTPVRAGFRFLGWSVGGEDTLYTDGTVQITAPTGTETITLTAHWERTHGKIFFYDYDGKLFATASYELGEETTVTLPTLRTRATLVGYHLGAANAGALYTDTFTITPEMTEAYPESISLYGKARMTIMEYTFDGEGATGMSWGGSEKNYTETVANGTSTVTIGGTTDAVYSCTLNMKSNVLVQELALKRPADSHTFAVSMQYRYGSGKDNYAYASINASNQLTVAGEVVATIGSEEFTRVAIITEFQNQGTADATATFWVYINGILVMDGKEVSNAFLQGGVINRCYWYVSKGQTGTTEFDNLLFSEGDDYTKYTKKLGATLKFDAAPGTMPAEYPTQYLYGGEAVALPTPNGEKENSVFDGWFTNPELTGEPLTSFVPGENKSIVTLYAKYHELTYDAVFVKNGVSNVQTGVYEFALPDTAEYWVSEAGELLAAGTTVKLAANTTYHALTVDLLSGASIRVSAPSGMRFESTVDKALLDAVTAGGYSFTVGTLIVPTDLLGANAFTAEALTAAGVSFLDLATDLTTASAAAGKYTYFSAIAEILAQNYTRAFSAVGYIEVVKDGETTRVYTGYTEADNSRSVYDVACRALKDYTAGTAQYATVKGFIDSVVTLDADCNVLAPAGATGYTAPYTVSYEGGVLTITEGGATVTTIVINGVAYTRGFTSVDGVITVNYTAPAAE